MQFKKRIIFAALLFVGVSTSSRSQEMFHPIISAGSLYHPTSVSSFTINGCEEYLVVTEKGDIGSPRVTITNLSTGDILQKDWSDRVSNGGPWDELGLLHSVVNQRENGEIELIVTYSCEEGRDGLRLGSLVAESYKITVGEHGMSLGNPTLVFEVPKPPAWIYNTIGFPRDLNTPTATQDENTHKGGALVLSSPTTLWMTVGDFCTYRARGGFTQARNKGEFVPTVIFDVGETLAWRAAQSVSSGVSPNFDLAAEAQALDERLVYLGKLIRFDLIDGVWTLAPPIEAGFAPGIRARGLRNAWSAAYNPILRTISLGIVGEHFTEWISFVPTDDQDHNLGWPLIEGNVCLNADWSWGASWSPLSPCNVEVPNFLPPHISYNHSAGYGSCVVNGLTIENGTKGIPSEWIGGHLFSDWMTGKVFLVPSGPDQQMAEIADNNYKLNGWHQSRSGRIYACDHVTGAVFQFSTTPPETICTPPETILNAVLEWTAYE